MLGLLPPEQLTRQISHLFADEELERCPERSQAVFRLGLRVKISFRPGD